MTTGDDLLEYIFGGRRPAFYAPFAAEVRESRRFRAFAHAYRDKIRAKLKNAGDDPGLLDLAAELETAALLLREARFAVEYETYAAAKQRGPDLTVTYKTHTPFNVEVRRLRRIEPEQDDADTRAARLTAVLVDKVGQMPPSIINFLWLVNESPLSEADLASAATGLLRTAEHKDDDLFARRGFTDAADFLRQFQRLSGIVARHSPAADLWLNPVARHKPPPDIAAALRRAASDSQNTML